MHYEYEYHEVLLSCDTPDLSPICAPDKTDDYRDNKNNDNDDNDAIVIQQFISEINKYYTDTQAYNDFINNHLAHSNLKNICNMLNKIKADDCLIIKQKSPTSINKIIISITLIQYYYHYLFETQLASDKLEFGNIFYQSILANSYNFNNLYTTIITILTNEPYTHNNSIYYKLLIINIKKFLAQSQLFFINSIIRIKFDNNINLDLQYFDDIQQIKSNNYILKYQPWFKNYNNYNPNKTVIIIGAGISGAASAYSLAKLGIKVVVYDTENKVASRASGNYQAVLYANFFGNHTDLTELYKTSYQYTYNLIYELLTQYHLKNNIVAQENKIFEACGLMQIINNEKQYQHYKKYLNVANNLNQNFAYIIDATKVADLLNQQLDNCYAAIYYPKAMWFDPKILITQLLQHPNITVHLNTKITQIEYLKENYDINYCVDNQDKQHGMWHLYADSNKKQFITKAYNVVMCNSYMINEIKQFKHLPLRKIRGQISVIDVEQEIQMIICDLAYITPKKYSYNTIGASFKFNNNDLNCDLNSLEHLENINNIAYNIPSILKQNQILDFTNQEFAKADIRSSTHDYLPIVGVISEIKSFYSQYMPLSKDANFKFIDNKQNECQYLTGLYLNIAHGSKGMLSAPFCGEIIAHYIANLPINCSKKLLDKLQANRLWCRSLIKQNFLL